MCLLSITNTNFTINQQFDMQFFLHKTGCIIIFYLNKNDFSFIESINYIA